MHSALVIDLIKSIGYTSVGIVFGYDDDRDYTIGVFPNGGRSLLNNNLEEHLYQIKYQSDSFSTGEAEVKKLADKLKFITSKEIKNSGSLGFELKGTATISLLTLPQFGGKIGNKYQWFLGILIKEIIGG